MQGGKPAGRAAAVGAAPDHEEGRDLRHDTTMSIHHFNWPGTRRCAGRRSIGTRPRCRLDNAVEAP